MEGAPMRAVYVGSFIVMAAMLMAAILLMAAG